MEFRKYVNNKNIHGEQEGYWNIWASLRQIAFLNVLVKNVFYWDVFVFV